ncbi:MAG: carboxypeptidase regulatory-like domain-containing protein [Bacillota bacterium]|jgi:hypothetical protein
MMRSTKQTAKWLSLISLVVALVCFTAAGVFAADMNSAEKPDGVSLTDTKAPQAQAADPGTYNIKEAGPSISPQVPNQNGYVNNLWKVYLKDFEQGGAGYVDPKVLIIEDTDSWTTGYQNEAALNNLGIYYDVISSGQISVTDLYGYTHILIPSDQPQSYYDNLDSNMAAITDWVKAGGSLQFNACDEGWNYGKWTNGPGGITHVTAQYIQQNYIQDINHPILQGMTDDDFYGWNYVSHGYFENLPEDAHVLLSMDADGSRPTMVEFNMGAGRVMATQNTMEWAIGHGHNPAFFTNTIDYMFKQGFDTLKWSVSDVNTALMDVDIDADKDMMYINPLAVGNDDVLLTLTDTNTGLSAEQWINIDIQEDTVPPVLNVDDLPQYTTSGVINVKGTTEPGATVLINGQQATVDKFGKFNGEATLNEGENNIIVESSDANNNKTTVDKKVIKDSIAPEVSNVQVTPSLVAVDNTLTISANISDQGSGVSGAQVYLTGPSNQYTSVYLYADNETGLWTGSSNVDKSMEPGVWKVDYIYSYDIAGNYGYSYQTEVTFEVENPYFDNVAPTVNSVVVTPQVVQPGQFVHISIDALDEKSGIKNMYGYFYNYQNWYNVYFYPNYNDETGKWEANVQVPDYFTDGTYNLQYLWLEDNAGNGREYYNNNFPDAYFTVSTMPDLVLSPEYQEVRPGETFNVNVDINNVSNLYGAEARISYDPNLVQVVDADPNLEGTQIDLGGVLSGLTAKNQVNNGEIWFSTSKNGEIDPDGFTGSGTIATITFKALTDVEGTADIEFIESQLSDATDPPSAIAHQQKNAQVYIGGLGNIVGQVILQGMPENKYNGAKVSLEGTGHFAYTDAAGNYNLSEITPGQYNLIVERPDWKPVFLTAGAFPVNVDYEQTTGVDTIKLLTGDVTSDNAVGISDLGSLAQAYAAFGDSPHYNYNADLNENSNIDLFDLVLMAKNWNKKGYGYAEQDNPMGKIEGVVMDASGNPISGAVVTVSGGEQTNGVFLAGYTNENGYYFFEHVNINDVYGNPIKEFTVEASKNGYATKNTSLVLTANEIHVVDFTLEEFVIPDPTIKYDFETDQGWQTTGFWHLIQNDSNIKNNAVPVFVSLPEGDETNAYVPNTPFGAKAFWYGQDATGNFIGTQISNDEALSGGTSVGPNSGDLTSPVIDLTGMTSPVLQFQSWWEIESVNPNASGFDLMTVKVYSVTEGTYYDLGRLNPWVDPYEENRFHLAFTSGGFNRPAVWVPYSFDLSKFAGQQIQVQFNFDTNDELYNGFRGWLIDEVGIYNVDTPAAEGVFGITSEATKVNTRQR